MTTPTKITLTLELPDDPQAAHDTLDAAIAAVQTKTYVSAVQYDSALLDSVVPAPVLPPVNQVPPTDPSELRKDTDPMPPESEASTEPLPEPGQ